MPGDPLFDTLFRPTATVASVASAAPIRSAGTRTRAGNAMARTRAALLDGARRAVAVTGTRITMAQVAAAAGVAKATLYNHFRTRDAVLAALLEEEVCAAIEQCSGQPVQQALAAAAVRISEHQLLRALARHEPATLAALACVDTTAPGWRRAEQAIDASLAAEQRGGATVALRWLSSFVLTPGAAESIHADVAVLMAGLPPTPGTSTTRQAAGPPAADEPRWTAQPA